MVAAVVMRVAVGGPALVGMEAAGARSLDYWYGVGVMRRMSDEAIRRLWGSCCGVRQWRDEEPPTSRMAVRG